MLAQETKTKLSIIKQYSNDLTRDIDHLVNLDLELLKFELGSRKTAKDNEIKAMQRLALEAEEERLTQEAQAKAAKAAKAASEAAEIVKAEAVAWAEAIARMEATEAVRYEVSLSKDTMLSLQKVLTYVSDLEKKHYEESSDDKKANHIYLDVLKVEKAFEFKDGKGIKKWK